ncbi:ABC transporter permease [Azospirillum thermophilum]|uniref:ABC transporter permease n=1 Tax=Azospirillum thermophilum TaxID=2202148 RepID=A0A2S2CMM0_9PROT|nr:ABC transporter permease [Azospirillum thermophilum]AWK85706.1 ABC transporter permease [Azospirillum thermophilum]
MTAPARLGRSTPGRAGLLLAALLLGLPAVAATLLPLDPSAMDLGRAWAGPSAAHPLGCDGLGRDVAARLIAGTGASLAIAGLALVLAVGLGFTLGGVAGWIGGRADAMVLRLADLLHGFPDLSLAIVAAALLGPGVEAMVLTLALAAWPSQVRWCRALVLSLRTAEHMAAAKALGAGPAHSMRHHLLPAMAGPIAIRAALSLGPVIVMEATLSALGLGVQEPAVSLGTLIRDGLADLHGGPHLIAATTVTVAAIALAVNLLAEGLRDGLDPRSTAARR